MLELVLRFLLVGALAFGGGQAALPLVERIAVAETGWLSPRDFAAGVGIAQATPGPVLILAAFVGHRAAGLPGALAATLAVFALPILLAALAARMAERWRGGAAFEAFGRFAGAAAIGLLGVTLASIAWPLVQAHPALALLSAAVFLAERGGASPILLLAGAAAAGGAWGALAG
ncbi:MAG: chromate transporter [Candidatus Tectomicrobia bacterium]|uniref:Chromate transporter n=1 Tax=Tectimicrobiota bacterium TaxID=2528274 RepID=A0A932MQV1_UNCTE|nr:chromate transporter [Candidatus Tectomicrobia bacterium]